MGVQIFAWSWVVLVETILSRQQPEFCLLLFMLILVTDEGSGEGGLQ